MKRFGTETYKIVRSDAPDTSWDAANRVDTKTDEETVYQHFVDAPNGLTLADLESLMGKPRHAISGRITALRDKGYIASVRRE